MYLPSFLVVGIINDNGIDRMKSIIITTNDRHRAKAMFKHKYDGSKVLKVVRQEA